MMLGDDVLKAETDIQYVTAMDKLDVFCGKHSEILDNWLTWWKKRPTHIFRAFKPLNTPNVNLAEIGHAKMTKEGQVNMTLIESCKKDLMLFLKQESEIKGFEKGILPPGRAPAKQQVEENSYRRQMSHARAYSRELHLPPVDESKLPQTKKFVPKIGIHRPRRVTDKTKKVTVAKRRKNTKYQEEEDEQEQKQEEEQEDNREDEEEQQQQQVSTGQALRKKRQTKTEIAISPKVFPYKRKRMRKVGERIKERSEAKSPFNNDDKGKSDTDKTCSFSAVSSCIGYIYSEPYHNDNPFVINFKKHKSSTKCPSCDVHFQADASPPHDITVQHDERYTYPNENGFYVYSRCDTRGKIYHARPDCLLARHPYFSKKRLCINEEDVNKVTDCHLAYLFQFFDISNFKEITVI